MFYLILLSVTLLIKTLAGTMSSSKTHKSDRTLLRIIVAVLIAVMLNAGITVWAIKAAQDKFATSTVQQQTQGKLIVNSICDTLVSLHDDKPPTGASPSNPSRVYLTDLHDRLGDLVNDLKC